MKTKMKAKLQTKSGKVGFVDEYNFEYNINRIRDTLSGLRTHLRCKSYYTTKCSAKAWLEENDNEYMYCVGTHNHTSNAPKVEAKLILQKVKEAAVACPMTEPRVLYGSMIGSRKLLPNVKAALPDKSNFTKEIHRARNADSIASAVTEPDTFEQLVKNMPEVSIFIRNLIKLRSCR